MLPKIKITFERWKFNKEYGLWVSTEGRVLDRYKQEVRIRINQSGYIKVWSEVIQKYVSIHRLVLMTWRPIKNAENLTVDHRDHNKRNNSLRNLIWMPLKENQLCEQEDKIHDKDVEQLICANGVTMTLENAVKFIYALPGTAGQYNKDGVRLKLIETLNSDKLKKTVFGITLEEVK